MPTSMMLELGVEGGSQSAFEVKEEGFQVPSKQ